MRGDLAGLATEGQLLTLVRSALTLPGVLGHGAVPAAPVAPWEDHSEACVHADSPGLSTRTWITSPFFITLQPHSMRGVGTDDGWPTPKNSVRAESPLSVGHRGISRFAHCLNFLRYSSWISATCVIS